MKNYIVLGLFIIGCLLVGLLAMPFTIWGVITWYPSLEKPFFNPPNWIFGPVWTVLYILMGVSAFLVWKKGTKHKNVRHALKLFAVQLVLNFLWSFLFFGMRSPILGLIDIGLLLYAIILTINAFKSVSPAAAYLLLPYLAWVSFASILNSAIVILNRG